MNDTVQGCEKTRFEDVIARDGRLLYTNVGISMMPLIRQRRDLLIIEKPSGRLKKYDVALYKRDSGQYVLHRILKVRKDDYMICGDNQWHRETGITDRHIIGVLTGLVRDGKELSLVHPDWKYKMYVHLWCDFFPVRAGILRIRNLYKRLMRALNRKVTR